MSEEKVLSRIGIIKKGVIAVSCIFLFAFSLYTGLFGPRAAVPQGTFHLIPIFILFYLTVPSGLFKKHPVIEGIFSIIFMLMGIISTLHFYLHWVEIMTFFRVGSFDILMGVLLTLAILEACRRSVARPLFYIALAAVVYTIWGHYLPGIIGHGRISWQHIVRFLGVGSNGIYGVPLWVGATYFILFMYFVSFLSASGAHEKFMNVAMAFVGHLTGGLAKVAVMASSLMGMTSGSAVANVLGTGSITIPLMKKYGYPKHIAGAIEATASTGGILMPPLMGVTAFIMAELMGVPYFDVMIAGFFPAILYYLAVFMMVDARSRKSGLVGLPKEELPPKSKAVKEVAPLLLAILVLIYLLSRRAGIAYAVSRSLLVLLAIIFIFKGTRLTPRGFLRAIIEGAKMMAPLTAALCTCSVVMGCLNMTGLSAKLSILIETISGGYLPIALLLTAVVAIILGMGMPPLAVYLMLATLTVPLLRKMGVGLFPANLFVFYFAAIAPITPPIMLATYAAVGIAKSDPMKTGLYAVRLAIVAFIVPFLFAYNPALLGIGSPSAVIFFFATAVIGVIALSIALEGMFFNRKLPPVLRPVFLAAAVLSMIPVTSLSLGGLVILGGSAGLTAILS